MRGKENIKFEKVLEKCIHRYDWSELSSKVEEMEKNDIDVDKKVNKEISEFLAKNIIREKTLDFNKKIYLDNDGDSRTDYTADVFVCNKKELFYLLNSFNSLNEDEKKERLMKLLPEEEAINQIRFDRLDDILGKENNGL